VLIELSTLTGAIIMALGSRYAGLFTNDDGLANDLVNVGKMLVNT
jgi:leucyl aminopeptidase